MATPSAMDELEALEQTRSRLEAALSGDENWRALRQSSADGNGVADSDARRARNTRLEMALADNTLYQAWKHLNGAIDALRARSVAQSQAAEPLVRPAPAAKATHLSAELPDDIAALLRSDAPEETPHGAQRAEPVAAAGPSPSTGAGTRAGLVDRLERMEKPPEAETKPAAPPAVEGSPRAQDRARPPERQANRVPAEPPEATVTFVVRESRAPLLPAEEPPPDLGTERNLALFERRRSLNEVPESADATYPPADEEAEVTIVPTEGLRQRREAEDRAGIVRRFRKALSGD